MSTPPSASGTAAVEIEGKLIRLRIWGHHIDESVTLNLQTARVLFEDGLDKVDQLEGKGPRQDTGEPEE